MGIFVKKGMVQGTINEHPQLFYMGVGGNIHFCNEVSLNEKGISCNP